MSKRFITGIALAVATAWPAHAQLDTFIDVCGDPDARPADVVHFCQKALDTGRLPKRAEAQVRTNRGIGLFQMQRYDEAVQEYSRAAAADAGLIDIYLNRARAYEKLGRLREAAADYAEALRRNPREANAYVGRGAMLLSHGDPQRAITDLTTAIKLQPDWVSPYFNRGVAHMRLRDYAAATVDFSFVIQRNPQDSAAYLNRGRARVGLGLAEAGADFDKAIELAPEWGGAWFARGQYWDSKGNTEAANGDFIRAYQLGYQDPWLVERMSRISQ